MHIIVDIDNTIADRTAGLNRQCRLEHGHELKEACFMRYNIFPTLEASHGYSYITWVHNLFSSPEFYGSLYPYRDAATTLDTFDAAGAKITYCTARSKNLGDVTETWLGEHDFPPGEIVHTRDKWLLRCDILIDDCPEILHLLQSYNKRTTVVSMLHPYSHEYGYPADLYFSNWEGLSDSLQVFAYYLR